MQTQKRFQCRHIFTDGHRCGSPCLRSEPFCYYHHTSRKPATPAPYNTFHLPPPEDRSSIQASIGEVLRRIANHEIDSKRAGLLLYGLQIAISNLPKPPKVVLRSRHDDIPAPPPTIEDIETDDLHGTLALITEIVEIDPEEKMTRGTLLYESWLEQNAGSDDEEDEDDDWLDNYDLTSPKPQPEPQPEPDTEPQPEPDTEPQPNTLPILEATAD